MTKFEELAVGKQEQAYNIKYAKYQFSESCNRCATYGLRNGRGSCANCPVLAAHTKAIEEIASGKREAPDYTPKNYGASKFHNRGGHETYVLRCDVNITITKEDK